MGSNSWLHKVLGFWALHGLILVYWAWSSCVRGVCPAHILEKITTKRRSSRWRKVFGPIKCKDIVVLHQIGNYLFILLLLLFFVRGNYLLKNKNLWDKEHLKWLNAFPESSFVVINPLKDVATKHFSLRDFCVGESERVELEITKLLRIITN